MEYIQWAQVRDLQGRCIVNKMIFTYIHQDLLSSTNPIGDYLFQLRIPSAWSREGEIYVFSSILVLTVDLFCLNLMIFLGAKQKNVSRSFEKTNWSLKRKWSYLIHYSPLSIFAATVVTPFASFKFLASAFATWQNAPFPMTLTMVTSVLLTSQLLLAGLGGV